MFISRKEYDKLQKEYQCIKEKYQVIKSELDYYKNEFSKDMSYQSISILERNDTLRKELDKNLIELENYKRLYIEQVEKNLILAKELSEREKQAN